MCFSAEASFISAGGLALAGVATLRKVRSLREVPLASFPLIFALQQFCEGFIWYRAGDVVAQEPWGEGGVSVLSFLLIAEGIWPLLAPLAAYLLEPQVVRKALLGVVVIIGAVLFINTAVGLAINVPLAIPAIHGIAYSSLPAYPTLSKIFYLMAVCSLTLSSHCWISVFGYLILVSNVWSELIFESSVLSSWCFFAAILSVVLLIHFYERDPSTQKQKVAND